MLTVLFNMLKKTGFLNLFLERATGIEPVTNAWEAFVLPLNYARINYVVEGIIVTD